MATLTTDKNRNLLLPKSDFLSDYWDCKFYSLPWATTESPQLLFDNFSTLLALETSQEFQIWYSEDLFKWGYGVNGFEKTCVAVYNLYVCEHSPFWILKFNLLPSTLPEKQNLLWFPRILCHSRRTRRFSMDFIMIFISRTKLCSAESKGGYKVQLSIFNSVDNLN